MMDTYDIVSALLIDAGTRGLQPVDVIFTLVETLLDWSDLDGDDIAQVLEPEAGILPLD